MKNTSFFNRSLVGLNLLSLTLHLGATPAEERRDSLLSLFPDSKAPTADLSKSEFSLNFNYRGDVHYDISKWIPEIDEKEVFHARMIHRSVEERSWDFGIGKGGQLYSMISSFGEAIAPQTMVGRWTDEVWQMTSIIGALLGRDIPKEKGKEEITNTFMQSGLYIRDKETPYFYSPILAEDVDLSRRTYSVLCWQIIPDPSINRSGMLCYNQYRDLGDGVIEVTYIVYNFGNHPLDNVSPWGGVRTSVFPEQVISNPDGTYRFWMPPEYGVGQDFIMHTNKTGGWAAMTQNASNPYAHSLGIVFGKLEAKPGYSDQGYYTSGLTGYSKRDYTVQSTAINIKDKPDHAHLQRMYFVLGPLGDVAKKANQLAEYAIYDPISFSEKDTPLVDLYLHTDPQGKSILSRKKPKEDSEKMGQVYSYPVPHSAPLFVIRDNETKELFVTTDPYARCATEPFVNPLTPDSPQFNHYENRKVYKPYLRKTEWVEFLGFAPTTALDGFHPISSIPEAGSFFFTGEGKDSQSVFIKPLSK
jgi:hypothetical protein